MYIAVMQAFLRDMHTRHHLVVWASSLGCTTSQTQNSSASKQHCASAGASGKSGYLVPCMAYMAARTTAEAISLATQAADLYSMPSAGAAASRRRSKVLAGLNSGCSTCYRDRWPDPGQHSHCWASVWRTAERQRHGRLDPPAERVIHACMEQYNESNPM